MYVQIYLNLSKLIKCYSSFVIFEESFFINKKHSQDLFYRQLNLVDFFLAKDLK